MKINEKYPQLKDKIFLAKLLTRNVYGSMALEDQKVPKRKVKAIITAVLKEFDSKDGQLIVNQKP